MEFWMDIYKIHRFAAPFFVLNRPQPAEGVLGNILIPSSRNNGLPLNPAFRMDEFTTRPAVGQ